MIFERRHEPLLSRSRFAVRMAASLAVAVCLDVLVIFIGTVGYRASEGLTWLDAMVNAALVITGNGPAYPARTPAGKAFTMFYAVVGCIAFVVVAGVLLAPVFHRLIHAFHLEVEQGGDK